MPNPIDELLQVDAANAEAALDQLRAFDQSAATAFDTAADLFASFNTCAAKAMSAADAADDRELEAISNHLRLTVPEMLARIASAETSPDVERARELWAGLHRRDPQRWVLLLCHRYFRWGTTDLLRYRLTSTLGYARLQAEACALLRLFVDDPARAEQWLHAAESEDSGRKFFSETKRPLNAIIGRYGLTNAYTFGSASSQHVRIASAVRGLSIDRTATVLRDQEVDPRDLFGFFNTAFWFLSVQVRVFASFLDSLAEVNCDRWRQRVENFASGVEGLRQLLDKRSSSRTDF